MSSEENGKPKKMDKTKKEKLVARGFKIGTVQEFLGLTDEEMAQIELLLRADKKAE